MRIVIEKNSLFEGLQRIYNVVPQKPTLPILSNFLLTVSGDENDPGLSISGTDMDMSITTKLGCSAEGEGSITVNAKRFISIVRELPEGEVAVEIDGEKVKVEFSGGQSSMMGMSSSDFPPLKESIDGVPVVLPGDEFFDIVDKTSFAVSTDRTRMTLTGVYVRLSSDDMVMVSTDGHRLSLFEKRLDITTDKVTEAIVPPKALNHAGRIFYSDAKLQRIVFGQGVMLFDFESTTVFTKLIEGPYPDFRQVIPLDNSKHIVISTERLESAVRRVSVLSSSITHQVRLALNPGRMEVRTTNADIGGEARESLEIDYDGESIVIGFNAVFLQEILRKIDTEEVLLEIEAPTIACILKPVYKEKKGEHIYLIMPLRLNE
ncbi:MAG: DNA polymerase III subunit beta [Candidatus Latescibacteria bacterium]|nr:DNA polymerase III subunit beta [Candidatus Latescibacterota bacterium]